MKSLKEYRNSELKWFLFANIMLMLVSSGVLTFGDVVDSGIANISSILNISAFSAAIYILTFVLDSVIPSWLKVRLVFLWKRQPSCTIFTDMEHKFSDNRFALEDAKKKYAKIYEQISAESKDFDQTPLWYEIYNQNRDNTIVFGSNRDYLLLRDMHAQTIMLILVYIALWSMADHKFFSFKFILYLVLMTIFLNISARVQGKRLMYNVLSVDVNKTEPIDNDVKKREIKND